MGGDDASRGRRVIAHVDADAFYASVHLIEDPSLAGRPVIVAGSGARSIVTTASYEARRYGIGSAMPASQARRLCPEATFLRPDFDLYRSYSRRAMDVVARYVEHVERLSLDEAYLDITELDRPVRTMREMVAEIERETGLRYSVGVGPNKLCAKVLSDHGKPRAFNVASREQCCELFAAHPARLIPGIGPRTAEALERMGITTIRGIREAPARRLTDAFGPRRGMELRDRACFLHDGVVQRERTVKSRSEETTFEVDVADLHELQSHLRAIADDLCSQLQRRGLRGRTIGIKVRLADFTTVTRARTLERHTNETETVAGIAAELLREYQPPQPVRLVGVRVAGFEQSDSADEAEGAPRPGQQLRLPLRAALSAGTGSRLPDPEAVNHVAGVHAERERRMTAPDDDASQQSAGSSGGSSVDRERAIELTRERLDSSFSPSDEEIWQAWQQVGGGGPTTEDDLGRVVAELEGISVDG